MRTLKRIGIFILVIFIIAPICAMIMENDFGTKVGAVLLLIIDLVALFCIIYFGVGGKTKCPTCKKRFVLKQMGQTVIGVQNISVKVETKSRDNTGRVTGTNEQYVPGERRTFRVDYVCKKCGKGCSRTYTQDRANI